MWSKLLTVLQTVVISLIVGSPFLLIRAAIFALVTGYLIRSGDNWVPLYQNMMAYGYQIMHLTVKSWGPVATAYTIANAWIPVTETCVVLTAVMLFRVVHVVIKLVQQIWEAVPLN